MLIDSGDKEMSEKMVSTFKESLTQQERLTNKQKNMALHITLEVSKD